MKKNIHLFIRGKKTGPHDMSEVRKLLSSGEISLYDIAEVDGSKILLHNIISLQTEVVVSPPPPQLPEMTRVPQVLDSDGPDNQLAKPVSRLVSKTPPPPPLQNQGNSFFCKYCGNQVIAAAVICPSCGAPTSGVPSLQLSDTINPIGSSNPSGGSNTLVISGYLCAIISLVFLPPAFGLAGMVIGIINLTRGKVGHGIAQIVLSVTLPIFGMTIWFVLLPLLRVIT